MDFVKLKPCKVCGKETASLEYGRHRKYYVQCECGQRGPEHRKPEKAVKLWNDEQI